MEGRRLLLVEGATGFVAMSQLPDATLDDIRDVCPVKDRFYVSLVIHVS
jgi:hypothetical protein